MHCGATTSVLIEAITETEMKINEWGFRPPLGTYRLNWAGKNPSELCW